MANCQVMRRMESGVEEDNKDTTHLRTVSQSSLILKETQLLFSLAQKRLGGTVLMILFILWVNLPNGKVMGYFWLIFEAMLEEIPGHLPESFRKLIPTVNPS